MRDYDLLTRAPPDMYMYQIPRCTVGSASGVQRGDLCIYLYYTVHAHSTYMWMWMWMWILWMFMFMQHVVV